MSKIGSWYVESLIRCARQIRNSILEFDPGYFDYNVSVDLDNDDYNNLLMVEKTLDVLKEKSLLTKRELDVLDCIIDDLSITAISKLYNLNRETVVSTIDRICDRVAFLLGDEFTDFGILAKLKEKYNLTDEQLERAYKFMASNKKYTLFTRDDPDNEFTKLLKRAYRYEELFDEFKKY